MKAWIKGVIGFVIGVVVAIGALIGGGTEIGILPTIGGAFAMGLAGFGYAFGWGFVKSAWSWSTDFCSGFAWWAKLIIIPCAVGMAFWPGIIRGIKCIIEEAREA